MKRAGTIFSWLDTALARCFGPQFNPMNYLGAMIIFFFWIVLISGIWLFIFFRTSVEGAYESVEYLTHQQWYIGGVMRSLHRYASDAAVVTLLLHIVREWSLGHHRGKRWFSWITGTPVIWLLIPLGISGYWLVWDKLALYVAITSSELIDWLPIFTGSMARNFLTAAELSDRFFTLMAFLHLIGLPLVLVFAIWLHVFRISRPRINPPRAVMAGTLIAMLALSFIWPALSQGQADPASVPQELGLDWYYLFFYPLVQAWGPAGVWALLVGLSLLLFLAPWLPPKSARQKVDRPVVVVDLDNCNGCQRCAEDCPYSAVMMQPRTDGSRYEQEAVVDADLCVSCGICVGSCPTATPFRQASALVPGIDLPDLSALMLREEIEQQSASLQGSQRIIVFSCDGSNNLQPLKDQQTAVIGLRCMAHLPPSFIDFIISRNHADGVFLAGCANGGCEYRLGTDWTSQRIARERDPRLRERTDRSKLAMGWEQPWSAQLTPARSLAAFRQQLMISSPIAIRTEGLQKKFWLQRLPLRAVAYGLFMVVAALFSAWPAFSLLGPEQAMVSLSISHTGQRIQECRKFTQEELNELPPNMRRPSDCPREKHPIRVEFSANGNVLYSQIIQPAGIWGDGSATIYARFPLPAGEQSLSIGMNDSGSTGDKADEFDYYSEQRIELQPEQNLVISFDAASSAFTFN
jgi:ferredoxin